MIHLEKYKKFFGQITNTKILVIIFIVGIGLMILPDHVHNEEKKVVIHEDGAEYKESLEQQLKSMLSKVKGVGNADVMITLENEGQTYFASNDRTELRQGEGTEDSNKEKNIVLKNDAGGGESPVIIKKNNPTISGILVIAKGVENVAVKNEIINAIRAVFGVQANRVEVLERK